ncbi:MAG: hypothetical protein H6730_34690 [Deltaproteobacteria bacterium]|nr:hypothetical protein [Deltaproteobacteria bacterium]
MDARTQAAPSGVWQRIVRLLTRPLASVWAERRAKRRLADLMTAAAARPHDDRVLMALAEAHRGAGRVDEAVQCLWQCAQLHTSSCHSLKGYAVLRQAADLKPDALYLRRALAQTLERLGRNREAAEEYRRTAALAEARGKRSDAEHLLGRAEMLSPAEPRPSVSPLVADLLPGATPSRLPVPMLTAPTPTPSVTPTAQIRRRVAVVVEAELQDPLPSRLVEPELPEGVRIMAEEASQHTEYMGEAPSGRRSFDRAGGPPRESGPMVPIIRLPDPDEVDRVVRHEMASAFGASPIAPPTTELALDAELFLLSNDPAEASTTACSPVEIHEIRTRTLLQQAERELQDELARHHEEVTFEYEIVEPSGLPGRW